MVLIAGKSTEKIASNQEDTNAQQLMEFLQYCFSFAYYKIKTPAYKTMVRFAITLEAKFDATFQFIQKISKLTMGYHTISFSEDGTFLLTFSIF